MTSWSPFQLNLFYDSICFFNCLDKWGPSGRCQPSTSFHGLSKSQKDSVYSCCNPNELLKISCVSSFNPGVLNWCLCLTWIRNLPSTSGFFEQECTFSFCLSSNCWCCQIGICVFRWTGRKEAQFPYKGDLKKKNWWLVEIFRKICGFHVKRDNNDQTQYLDTFNAVKMVLGYDHDRRGAGREEDENDI